ncbi:MFS transporter [Streptomyces smyrnaeus]|uniref:MFS transporter n=1 Tax=Streptomyces smyrnaeus TaxID=1387713 RepID=UPI0036BDAC4F
MQRNIIILLCIGHACVDVYQGSVAALVPLFIAERHYEYAAASGIVTAASLLSSVTQPAFGALSDRRRMPWLLPVSTAISGVGIAVSGIVGEYGPTLVFIALAGIAFAAYHPVSAQLARTASAGSHRAMSWFSLGGNLGFAAAPLMVAAVAASGGLRFTPLLLAPAAIGVLTCVPVIRHLGRTSRPASRSETAPRTRRQDWRSFGRLTVAVACRSIVFVGLSTFVALYAQQKVTGSVAGSAAVFALYAGGAVGTLLGGRLAGRWDRIVVSRWSYIGAAASVGLLLLAPGGLIYPFIVLTAVGLYVPFSLQVTLAQDYLPRNAGTASGVTLGLAISVGGVFTPLLGLLADHTTLHTALLPLAAMPLLAWLALRGLPEPETPGAARASSERSPGEQRGAGGHRTAKALPRPVPTDRSLPTDRAATSSEDS